MVTVPGSDAARAGPAQMVKRITRTASSILRERVSSRRYLDLIMISFPYLEMVTSEETSIGTSLKD
jgi:hypothetical protein